MAAALSADVIVIGSGAGGAAVAGELAAQGRRVLIFEAGERFPEWLGAHARNVDPSEAGLAAFGQLLDSNLVYPSGGTAAIAGADGYKVAHVFGGMFALWTSNCPTPHRLELPDWDDEESWRTYLDKARDRLHVTTAIGQDGVRMQRLLAATRQAVGTLPAGREVQPMPVAIRQENNKLRFSSVGDLLRIETLPEDRIEIVTGTVVRRIAHRGGRASGVVFAPRGGGPESEAVAETIVVAAGTIGSPTLLAGSSLDCGPALGSGVFDHPAFASRVILRPEIRDGVPEDDPIFSIWVPFSEEHPWHNQLCLFPVLPAPLSPPRQGRETVDIFTWIAMDVEPENRLIFHPGRSDPFGLPEVSATIRHSAATRERAALGLAEHFRIAAEIGDLHEGWHPAFYKTGESTHLMGTCRMGPADDGNSVVDRDGRLWHYENIYIAGNAVLAQPNAGNPTLMTVSAALRTADAILRA